MANRKTRRREKVKIDYSSLQASNQFNSLVKILGGILAIFAAFYFLTVLATGGLKSSNTNTNNNETATEIQYKQILAGETFSMSDNEYIVLFYDSKANDAALYNTFISKYEQSTGTVPLYIVDLHNGFNKDCIANTSNSNVQKSTDLKIKGPTLIRIKNHQNIKYIEGTTAIQAYL